MHYYLLGIIIVLAIAGLAVLIYLLTLKSKKSSQAKQPSNTIAGDKNQLASIFSSIEDGLVLIDASGVITLINASAGNLTGWKVEDAIGIDIKLVVKLADSHGNIYNDQNYPFNYAMTTGQSIRDKNSELISRNNQKIPVGLSITPLKDTNGRVNGAVALISNITTEKEQENRLVDFISTASHEMRTPVAAIEGYLSLALNNRVAAIDDKARGYLEKAQSETKHLGVLFQDLLTSAKAEDGRLSSHPEVVELGALIKSSAEEFKLINKKPNLRTDFVIGSAIQTNNAVEGEHQVAPLYYVYIDPERIKEVITNLYDNAVKYTSQGSITIGLTGDNQTVQFYIKDTGTGIPAEDMPHLFQKFYRVDNTETRTVGGTGLGLFICKKIVELYNGRIWVDSAVGKGSTFYVNLPRLTDQQVTGIRTHQINPANITKATT